jgi:PmbA protein
MAPHLSISEAPFLPKGLRSSPFDSEGIAGQTRDVVRDGVLEGYFLSAYSARRLGLATTGNADGIHNLSLNSQVKAEGGLPALLEMMGSGLLVTGMLGESLNALTGDYSRGAYGFWIEHGECVRPVERVTITGNLWTMLSNVIAVGDDRADHGGLISGSVLISEMAVSGQ